jgi:hypothetical protein
MRRRAKQSPLTNDETPAAPERRRARPAGEHARRFTVVMVG